MALLLPKKKRKRKKNLDKLRSRKSTYPTNFFFFFLGTYITIYIYIMISCLNLAVGWCRLDKTRQIKVNTIIYIYIYIYIDMNWDPAKENLYHHKWYLCVWTLVLVVFHHETQYQQEKWERTCQQQRVIRPNHMLGPEIYIFRRKTFTASKEIIKIKVARYWKIPSQNELFGP